VVFDGVTYLTVEHAYQAAKTADPAERLAIQYAQTPGQAKRLGRKVTVRPGWWDGGQLVAMERLLRQKFAPGTELAARLLETGDQFLAEGNNWHDQFWGNCRCARCKAQGANHLGKLLMKIRAELWEVDDGDPDR
jgi:ribA/ribD-fused uncharacterized protein